MIFPKMYQIHQCFETNCIGDIAASVRQEFSRFKPNAKIHKGQSVAIAVGSRGIKNLRTIVLTVVESMRKLGLEPFIIPAMGSHGGATAEGQVKVLKELDITVDSIGSPIVSSMDVTSLGKLNSGAEVFFSKDALEADYLVVINRVKPHPAFRADVESGLCKMLSVGLGKQKGASHMHKFSLPRTIVPAARKILQRAPILCGLAVVENSHGETHTIKLAQPGEFVAVDKELLNLAWKLFPKLPVDDLDILIIDEIGKDISGAGMDPNVIGFWRRDGGPRKPNYRLILVLDLSAKTYGNAAGIGMADLTTRRVIDNIDLEVTYINALTSWLPRSVQLPIALENDKVALEKAVSQTPNPEEVRMVRIKNTLSLETFWCTKALLPELENKKGLIPNCTPLELEFSPEGRLLPSLNQ
jgi:hypothetical protein